MFFDPQVADVRQADTVEAVVRFHEKFRHWSHKNANGYLISPNGRKAQSTLPYAFVFRAGPVCAGNYSVRIPLPRELKLFAGTRYGVSRATGLPNGFEFKGFESQREAAEFVKELGTMSISRFIQWLKAGDGSGRFYHNGYRTTFNQLARMFA